MGMNHPNDETLQRTSRELFATAPVSSLGTPVIDPVIQLDRLEVRLGGRVVLDGLTGELRGNAIGLLGPNGAGKSTLINTLLGFHYALPRNRPRLRPGCGARSRRASARASATCRRTIRSSAT